MTRWSEQQLKDYQTRRMSQGTSSLPVSLPNEGEDHESTIQVQAEQWCKDHGYPFLSFKQSKHAKRLLPAGWPDMLIALPKRIVFIEFKSKTGRRSKEQNELTLIFMHLGHEIHLVKTYKKFLEVVKL